MDRAGYIVKLLAALKQINSDRQEKQNNTPNNDLIQPAGGNRISNNSGKTVDDPGGEKPIPSTEPPKPQNRHFTLHATLDSTRVVKNVGNLMDEVINHLMQVEGAKVTIELHVEAEMEDGTPVPIVRTVTENCRALKVEDFGFSEN